MKQQVKLHLFYSFKVYYITLISFSKAIMSMSRSVASKASNASSKMLEQLASRSQTKILRSQGAFNDQQMRVIWNALGLYINRNLRMGRGVVVPRLGVFTFTPPQVRLKGVTNENQRDKKPRTPVFLIQKDFVKGINYKTAIFYHQQFGKGLRPYASFGQNGEVPTTKMNITQISSYADMSKDATEIAISRMMKYLSQKLQQGNNLRFQIPSVGTLISQGNLVAVRFNEQLHRQTRTILSKSLDQRKQRGLMNLTSENLKRLTNFSQLSQKLSNKQKEFFDIDEGARNYLQSTLGLTVASTAGLKKTNTNFNKSLINRPFDASGPDFLNTFASGYTTGKIKNFNREYNYALKIVKEWVYKNSLTTQKSFRDFCRLTGSNRQLLNEDDVWTACKKVSSDITLQQGQQLFRLLDFNKDGYVTQDDWKKNISFDSNKLLRQLVDRIKSKNYKMSQVLRIMKLEGVKTVGVYNLKESLMNMVASLSEDDALFLSRYICKGRPQISIQSVVDVLRISSLQSEKVTVDSEWEDKFMGRIKRKMMESLVYEDDLMNRFSFYDSTGTGFIDQTQFKNVLGQIGIPISLSELIKVVKMFPINSSNQINYQHLVARLNLLDPPETQARLTPKGFEKAFFGLFMNDKPTFKLPISVIELTSYIQTKCLKQYPQKQIFPHVQSVDINRDGYVTNQDIKAFQVRTQSNQTSQMDDPSINNLFTRLKQKTIKKKMSFYDLFKLIDTSNNGFITQQQWLKNIDKVMPFTQVQKRNMFTFMNKIKRIQMIDYKTFLSFVNSQYNPKLKPHEKFDWVEQVFDKIKHWYRTSKLTLEDSFRLADKDGDTYLNEKDIISFLVQHIKILQQQTSIVRIQKLIKVLDTFKKGKLNFLDWKNLFQKGKTDWVEDAKQQIGIVISRMYGNLEDAYTSITQGDKKLLFNAFEKWIRTNKVLSGFMINEDILKHLYSCLDSHKKGYLLQNDFLSAFSKFQWKVQHVKEYIQQLKTKFKSCNEAFRCLVSFKNTESLSEQTFYESSKTIYGNRFSNSDLQSIWKFIASGRSNISFEQFENKYGQQWKKQENAIDKVFPKDNWLYRDFPIIKGTQTRSPQFDYSQAQKMEIQSTQLLQNFKDMLSTSPKTLEQAFVEVDTEKRGKITNLQFKKAFRILNIALTSKQIDLLLNYCDFHIQKLIDWGQFMKKISIRDEKKRIVERLLPKIQHLSDLLHYYMVSPKDAFRKCNNHRSGYMPFLVILQNGKDSICTGFLKPTLIPASKGVV